MNFIFSSIQELKQNPATPSQNDTADILGYFGNADGGGGQFYWETAAGIKGKPDNGGTIIKQMNQGNTGRWIRVFVGAVNVMWFGARTVTVNNPNLDSSLSFQAAIDNALYNEVFIPAGEYFIGTQLNINKENIKITGEGKSTVLRASGISIFYISSGNYDPASFQKGNEIRDLTLKGDLSGGLPLSGTEGINLYGVINGILEKIYYSGLDKVINQQQAESYIFRNITAVDLEKISDDCNYIIYSNGQNRRSNDNIYTEIVGRALISEIYLTASTTGGGIHDGVNISECILFKCSSYNIYIEEARQSTITANKLFTAGKEALKLSNPIYYNIIGNLIYHPGNDQLSNGISLLFSAGSPLFGDGTVIGNIIITPSGNGIEVTGTNGITIADNIIISPCAVGRHDYGQKDDCSGIKINNSKNFIVKGNLCHPFYDNYVPEPHFYSVDWKADIEIDSLSFGSIDHNQTYQSKGVLNLSPNVLEYGGYPDEEKIECPLVYQLLNGVFGYEITNWGTSKTPGTPASAETKIFNDLTVGVTFPESDQIVYRFPTIGNKSIRAEFGSVDEEESTWMYRGVGSYVYKDDYITFSLWAKCDETAILSMELFTSDTPSNKAIRIIYVDSTWKRFHLTMQSKERQIPIIKLISTNQSAKTVYFSPIQVTFTKNPLPTVFRICYGANAPATGFWYKGDIIKNNNPTILGSAGSQYIVESWLCLESGAPGTWINLKVSI